MLGNEGQDEPFYYSQAHCEADILWVFWSDPPYARKKNHGEPHILHYVPFDHGEANARSRVRSKEAPLHQSSKNNQQGTDLCACAKKSTIALIFGDRAMIV